MSDMKKFPAKFSTKCHVCSKKLNIGDSVYGTVHPETKKWFIICPTCHEEGDYSGAEDDWREMFKGEEESEKEEKPEKEEKVRFEQYIANTARFKI